MNKGYVFVLCGTIALAAVHSAMAGEGRSLAIEYNAFFPDAIVTNCDVAAYADGTFPDGATVTLTAVPSSGGSFKKWYGDVPREDCANPSVSFTMDRDRWIYARIVHPWALSADKTTMTDGNFTVNVSVLDEAAHTLTVGKFAIPGLLADGDTGTGIVDLGGAILLDGDDAPWSIAKFAATKGTQVVSISHAGEVYGYISPGSVTVANTAQIFHRGDGDDKAGALYRLLILDEPAIPKLTENHFMRYQTAIERLILDIPAVVELSGGMRTFYDMTLLTKTRFDWWDLSAVAKMDCIVFGYKWGTYGDLVKRLPCAGKLSLPGMRGLNWLSPATGSEGGTQLFLMEKVEEISLGGATEATTVTNLCTYAFAGDSSLRKLTLHADPGMVVGKRIFSPHTHNTENGTETIDGVEYNLGTQTLRGSVPAVIHLTGQAISMAAVSNLLADAELVSTAEKPVAIHASRYQDGWLLNRRDWISDPTAEERAAYPGERVIGVYRDGHEAPAGKAVILHRANSWDMIQRPLFMTLR